MNNLTMLVVSSKCVTILLWQLLAILISGTGAFSQLLASSLHYIVLPRKSMTSQVSKSKSTSPYQRVVVLGVHSDDDSAVQSSASVSWYRRVRHWFLEVDLLYPWWKYAFLAFADVEGNFFLVTAYQYTTISSVQLLDCFTIPVVMVLSRFAFSTKYSWRHIVSGAVCTIGLVLLVISDLLTNRYGDENANRRVIGDVLVLVGCVFYGCSNVGQELMVKQNAHPPASARHEYLAMIGALGSCISAVQMAILERHQIAQVEWGDVAVLLYMLGFALCLVSLYVVTPFLLQRSSAVLMNLSFLTADFWSVLIAVYLFHAHLHPLYFVAFTIIVVGIIAYHTAPIHHEREAVVISADTVVECNSPCSS